MRHSLIPRLSATLFALWFTVLTVAAGRLHTCPTHDGAPVGATPVSHAGHQMHPDGATGHQASPEHSAPAPDHGGSHEHCKCLGACCMVAPTAMPTVVQLATMERDPTRPGLPEYEFVRVARAHQLPFSNGPPPA